MVEVIYDGNLGNNLFQYCFGRIIAENLNFELKALPILGFPRTFEKVVGENYSNSGNKIILTGQKIDLEKVLSTSKNCHIILHGYFQRNEYYTPYKAKINHWLKSDYIVNEKVSSSDLVIGIRRGKDYIPKHGLPLSYYETAINLFNYNKIYICSDSPSDPFVKYFEKKYHAVLRPAAALDNFNFIMLFNNIIISNSTFLWWAAYLSSAEKIVFPLPQNGFWSSSDPISTNIDLIVEDKRYIYLPAEKYKSQFLSEKLMVLKNNNISLIKRCLKVVFPFLIKSKPSNVIKFSDEQC